MDEKQKKIVSNNFRLLSNNLMAEILCTQLIESGVISMEDSSVIKSKPSKSFQVEELLQYVFRSPVPNTYQLFLDCLEETGYSYIKEKLEESATGNTNHSTSNETYETEQNSSALSIDDSSAYSVDEVPLPVSYFFDRIDLEQQVCKHLEENVFVILAGIKGAGKTQMARHLIHKMKNPSSINTPKGVQMEIAAKTKDNLCRDVENLMQALNVHNRYGVNDLDKQITSGLKVVFNQLRKLPTSNSRYHYLFFDDVTSDTFSFLTSHQLKDYLHCCDKIRIIITTNHTNLYYPKNIIVKGFEQQEALNFYKRDNESEEKDDDIIKLTDQISCLPLGIAVAKQFIRRRRLTIKDYLEQLHSPSLSEKLKSKEAAVLVEKEYDRGLMSALSLSIDEIASFVSPNMFGLYELTALGSHVLFPLSALKILMNWTDDEVGKNYELEDLVEAISDVALGTVTIEENEKYLEIHEAVLLAIRKKWSPDQFRANIKSFLILMSKMCSKDARFSQAFHMQMTLVPHAERAMEHFQELNTRSIALQVAEIRLLESLGYMYAQISLLEKSKHYLVRARDFFAQCFLHNNTSLFQSCDNDVDTKKNAEKILELLAVTSTETNPHDFQQFILDHALQPRECKIWRDVLQQKFSMKGTEKFFTGFTLSREDLLFLQKYDLALSEDMIQKVFLPELIISTLLTFGRLYFFSSSKGQLIDKKDRAEFESSLQLAYDLCSIIHKHKNYEIPLLHLKLTKYYGLMFFKMDKEDKSVECYVKVLKELKSDYAKLLEDELGYFKNGLLQEIPHEDYNTAVCLRQLIKCQVKLLEFDSWENWQTNKETGMKYVEQLHEILSRNQNVYRDSGFNLYVAEFQALIALKEKQKENFKTAVEKFSSCCDTEYKSGYVRYPWLLALEGLAQLVLQFGITEKNHKALLLAITNTEDFLGTLQGHSALYPFEWKKAHEILKEVKTFRESLSCMP